MVDGKRWEQLIVTHLPLLFEFKFQVFCFKENLTSTLVMDEVISSFKASFWLKRGWFVVLDCHSSFGLHFYTYERWEKRHKTLPITFDIRMVTTGVDNHPQNSIRALTISGGINERISTMKSLTYQYPNVRHLIIDCDSIVDNAVVIQNLSSVVDVSKLTMLTAKERPVNLVRELILKYDLKYMTSLTITFSLLLNITHQFDNETQVWCEQITTLMLRFVGWIDLVQWLKFADLFNKNLKYLSIYGTRSDTMYTIMPLIFERMKRLKKFIIALEYSHDRMFRSDQFEQWFEHYIQLNALDIDCEHNDNALDIAFT
ncbi:unnamed protein product [Didymodactylos carnosus]|uniref:Uncharacterized protein n=1 Tax=Didymodactylos carnosus TaxID=1234261 RepID=A0A8S2EFZ0_9BILA|nr:unnamed protein product [Didymodactylos carnosus]CAF3921175.1 unnamed protein product [Didymodactylos carnosus]